MAYDGLVFDIDGTLWDTTRPVTRAWNEVAQEEGIRPVTEKDIQSVMGLSHEEAFARLLPGMAEAKREGAAELFYEREVKLLRDNYLYAGVAEGIAQLAKNFPLYLVSNCQAAYLKRFQEISGLGKYFKDAECHGATGKPKGDNISLVLRRNKVSRAAYVGDTAGDQIAARQAGADYYHVNYGFGSPAQECLSFDSFAQVQAFFTSLL